MTNTGKNIESIKNKQFISETLWHTPVSPVTGITNTETKAEDYKFKLDDLARPCLTVGDRDVNHCVAQSSIPSSAKKRKKSIY